MTLTELAEHYFQVNVFRSKTIETYRECVRAFVRDHGKDPDIRELDAAAFLRFRDAHVKRNQRASYNLRRRHLSTLMRFAVAEKYLTESPLARVSRIAMPHGLPRCLSEMQIATALRIIESEQSLELRGKFAPQWFWRGVLQTLYYTGMRRAQLLGLRWEDINFNTKLIHLRADSSKTWREWHIPLAAALEPPLLDLKERTATAAGSIDPQAQVFRLPLFLPRRFSHVELTEHRFSSFFTRLSRAVAGELNDTSIKITAHRFRHTAATLLMRKTKGNIKVVQTILGHRDVNSTLIYVSTDLSDMREALEQL